MKSLVSQFIFIINEILSEDDFLFTEKQWRREGQKYFCSSDQQKL